MEKEMWNRIIIHSLDRSFTVVMLFLISCTIYAQTTSQIVIRSAELSPDGIRLATGDSEGVVRIWDTKTSEILRTIDVHDQAVTVLAWSPDGQKLATGSFDGSASVWNIQKQEKIYSLSGHGQPVSSIVWSVNGAYLYTGTTDADLQPALRQWNAETGLLLNEIDGVAGSLHVTNDGKYLLISGAGIQSRDPLTLELAGRFNLTDDSDNGFLNTVKSTSPDGKTLVVGYINGWVRVWDVATTTLIAQFPAHNEHICCRINAAEVEAVYFDGVILTSITQDGTFRVWDTRSSELLFEVLTLTTTRRTEFSRYGARLMVVADYPAEDHLLIDKLIRVPDPSLERLNSIAQTCISSEGQRGLTLASDTAQLPEFVAQLDTLTDTQIPPGCRADLLAIVEAIRGE